MTKTELENLKIGDICIFRRGHDAGKKCIVLYKHNFSCSEISEITGVKESVIRNLLYQNSVNSKEKTGRYPWGE